MVRESDVARVEYERSLGASDGGLYSVCVRARFMAARTLAGGVEGSTFVVDALFSGRELDPRATFLFDICLAEELLQRAVAHLHQTHLDEQLPHLFGAGKPPPTAGAIARVIWEAVAEGLPPEHRLAGLKVLVESTTRRRQSTLDPSRLQTATAAAATTAAAAQARRPPEEKGPSSDAAAA